VKLVSNPLDAYHPICGEKANSCHVR